MNIAADLRKSVTQASPAYVLVGAADKAVAKVREVAGRSGSLREHADLQSLREQAQQLPNDAVAKMLEVAGRTSKSYDELAERGKAVLTAVADGQASRNFVGQGRSTVARTKAAATTLRHSVRQTASAAKATGETAERSARDVAASAHTAADSTKASARRTATTAKQRAAATSRAGKATATSARKTGASGRKAASSAAKKSGRTR